MRNAPDTVKDGCSQEKPEVLRKDQDESRDAPGNQVGEKCGQPSAKFISDRTADQGGKYLKSHADAGDQSDLLVG
jgi:hypothetical protein